MKTKLISLSLIVCMLMTWFVVPQGVNAATNSDGYIEIRTIEDLYNVRNDLTANYILMNDIDLTDVTAPGGTWDYEGRGWNPIGSGDAYSNNVFSGIFDGNGYSITGMRIEASSFPDGTGEYAYLGLFSNVSGTVKNLRICGEISANSTSKSFYVGGISAYSTGTIDNCFSDVDINVISKRSYVKNTYAGGIVGYATTGMITNCVNNGTVLVEVGDYRDSAYASGIVGYGSSDNVNISNSYNVGNVISKAKSYYYDSSSYGYPGYAYAAGIVNYKSTVENCYNTADITATYTGAERNRYGYAYGVGGSVVSKSYNIGTVSGVTSRYGVANGTIFNCYYLSGTGNSSAGATSLTEAQMLLSSVYNGFDFDNTWIHNSSAIYPYPQLKSHPQDLRVIESVTLLSEPNKTEYKYGENLDLAGTKIKINTNGEDEEVTVTEDMVSGYNPKEPGVQTITVTYKTYTVTFDVVVKEKVYIPIYTIEDLYNVRLDLTANYILMNDIDLTEATAEGGDWDFGGRGWNPIGSNDIYSNKAFSGEFDGNGHKIIGMRIDETSVPSGTGDVYLGLFSNITGEVHDLVFEGGSINYEISNKTVYAGSLCASAENAKISRISGRLENMVADVTMYSNAPLFATFGGVVGKSTNSNITMCSNTSDFKLRSKDDSFKNYVGGIVGESSKDVITESYNTGEIKVTLATSSYSTSSKVYCGGICGYGSSTITNCYNSGNVTTTDMTPTYAAGIAVNGNISQCYNVGTTNSKNKYGIGGNSVSNSYYLTNSGLSTTGAASLTDSQMRIQSMYKGFDFSDVWTLNEFANHPYPQLKNNIQDLSESASLVSIISLPVKTEYMTGDKLDFTGAMVKVVYVSGREEIINITEEMVSGYDMNVAGEQDVTVTVAGASDSYTINVIDRPVVLSVEIISQPNVTKFAVGAQFDFAGAKAKVSYVGGITETVNITYDMTSGGNINHIGKQTITYSMGGKSASFEIEVIGIGIDEILLTSLPNKLYYLEGEKFELDGMVLTAIMNNGIKNTIASGYTVTGYSSEPGEYKITISYLGKETSFDVTVAKRQLVKLVLNSLPDKREYFAGEEFDDSGMQIIATYDNGDVIVAEDYTITGYDDIPGIKNIVVSLEGKSVSFTVKVVRRVITDFNIASLPSKLDYIEYESFDKSGLVVEATYNDGITEEIADYELTGFVSRPGTHLISVAYEGFVETFNVNVVPRILEDVKVIAPNKVVYEIGEEFDDTGLVVTAYYNNGQEITLDKEDYQISGFDSAASGTKSIKISYNGFERSFAVVVYERASIETGGHMTVGTAIGRLGEEVIIPVIVTKNTGIAGFKHDISFNADNLAFVSVEMVGDFADGSLVINDENADEGKLNLVWYDSKDVSGDGTVYNIVFEILETATDGDTDINIEFEENGNGNVSGENVTFTPSNGSVEVRSYWLGDLNDDRVYGMVDLLKLAQYVSGMSINLTDKQKLSADVNEDGTIDIHDVIMLQQWLLVSDMSSISMFSLRTMVDEAATEFEFGNVTAKIGDEVTIPVVIKNNPGLATYRFRVTYDTSALEFVSAENGKIATSGTLSSTVDNENGTMTFLWYSTSNVVGDGEIALLKFKVKDEARGNYPLTVTYLPEDVVNEDYEPITYSVINGKISTGSTSAGLVRTFGLETDPVTIRLLEDGTEIDFITTRNGEYSFESIAPGSYTLEVSKKNHTTRTYEIAVGTEDISQNLELWLNGDVTGDGQVKINDYAKVLAAVRGTDNLDGYSALCGDINGDGDIKINDYAKILAHVRGTSSLWE